MQASQKEQREVTLILVVEGVGGREMHRLLKTVCDEYSSCRSSVIEWRERFIEEHELLEDDARPGQEQRVITS
ncbi:uncharacterized protein TNCT_71 [Trichonephila clavata]|uniref:Transposase n=1 Tax=Trichonephila clavata TaxID=2740835 RepID=A0A8X6KT89_TRICU|nr:uncharacterized protein TNCT_71 [Trichonephila clavata]